jgi:hypothetical protein
MIKDKFSVPVFDCSTNKVSTEEKTISISAKPSPVFYLSRLKGLVWS